MSTTAASESDLGETSSTLIVVVLYRSPGVDETGSDLVTLRCLEAIYADRREILAGYRILLWDNSPQRWDSRELTLPCEYRHAASEGLPNDGVSGAYNAALQACIRDGCQWILLLDQDTEVTRRNTWPACWSIGGSLIRMNASLLWRRCCLRKIFSFRLNRY